MLGLVVAICQRKRRKHCKIRPSSFGATSHTFHYILTFHRVTLSWLTCLCWYRGSAVHADNTTHSVVGILLQRSLSANDVMSQADKRPLSSGDTYTIYPLGGQHLSSSQLRHTSYLTYEKGNPYSISIHGSLWPKTAHTLNNLYAVLVIQHSLTMQTLNCSGFAHNLHNKYCLPTQQPCNGNEVSCSLAWQQSNEQMVGWV